MNKKMLWQIAIAIVFVSAIAVLTIDTQAQQSQSRPSRRVANTAVTNASPTPTPKSSSGEIKILSLAEETNGETANTQPTTTPRKKKQTASLDAEQEYLWRAMNELTAEVRALSERVGEMEEKQQTLVDLEILSRAEQRAEVLHGQLFDTKTKESELKGRLAQIEFEIKPEIIERATSLIGSTRPEDLREVRRRQLEAEKQRVFEQLQMVEQNRYRLEQAVANADMLVERLRKRLEDNLDNPLPRRERPTPKAKEKQTDTTNQTNKDPNKYPEPPDEM